MADGNGTNGTNGNGNGFTTKEILVRLEDKVDKILEDHELRIRAVERFRWTFPSIAVLGALATIALTAYTLVQH